MKIHRLIYLALAMSSSMVFGQNGSISGSVINISNNDMIPFASIALVTEEQSAATRGTVSDADGRFTIEGLRSGSYNIIISFIGYNNDTISRISISRENPDIDIGKVGLVPAILSLDEVEITATAKTVSTKIDRKVYRASDFETAQGGTAVDILNKLPSVSVSPDGIVTVRGSTDFMVYLNGKPTLTDPSVLLAQLSGETIENIEVITVPTAIYDAQGKGGIINITTIKKGADGLSLSINGLGGGAPWGNLSDPFSGFKQNDNRYGGGLNLIYNKEKLSAYGGINYKRRNVNGSRTGDARLLQENGSYYHMVASGERPEWYENFSSNAGFDYRWNEKAVLSANYFYGYRREGRSAYYLYNNFYGDVNKDSIPGVSVNNDWVYNPNTDNRYGRFHTTNIDYRQKLSEKSEISLSALFEHSELSRELDNRNYSYNKSSESIGALENHFRQSDETPLNGYRFSIDYSKEFDNGHSLRTGLHPQYLNHSGAFNYDTFSVDLGAWDSYRELENAVELRRGIYAGYVDYTGAAGTLTYIAGLRLEYTRQSMDIDNPDYFTIFDRQTKSLYQVNKMDWFPTLHLELPISDNDGLSLSTSRRINRPPTKNMAPFLYRRHYEVYVVGDPALKPEYLYNLEVSYNRKLGNQTLNLTGFYRDVKNIIFRVNTVYGEENVLIRSYTNSGNTKAMGSELNLNIQAASFIRIFLGGSLYNYNVEGDIFGYKEDNSSMNWSLKGNTNFFLSKSLTFTLDFDMRSETVTAQGRNEMFYLTNLALSYRPQEMKGWDISLRILDLMGTNITGLNTRAFDPDGIQIFYQEVEYDRYGPIIELGLKYSFNMNGKSKSTEESTFGKEQF